MELVSQKTERNLLRTSNYSTIRCRLPCAWEVLCGHVDRVLSTALFTPSIAES